MITILSILAVLGIWNQPNSTIPFDDAVNQRKITAQAVVNEKSAHFQQPVLLELKNITSAPMSIELPVGRYFASNDTTKQNFVSTEPLFVTLSPGEVKKIPVSAMCLNHSKGAPQSGMDFKIKKQANPQLVKTAEFIHKNGLSGTYLGQTAMWCISDKEPLENVFSYNEAKVTETLQFLSTLTGKPVPAPPAADDYLRNPRARPKISVGGAFEFRFSSPKAIQVAMFDTQNIAVRELYNNPTEPAGSRKVEFAFDASVYNQGPYYIRFLVDNRIMMEQEMSF